MTHGYYDIMYVYVRMYNKRLRLLLSKSVSGRRMPRQGQGKAVQITGYCTGHRLLCDATQEKWWRRRRRRTWTTAKEEDQVPRRQQGQEMQRMYKKCDCSRRLQEVWSQKDLLENVI